MTTFIAALVAFIVAMGAMAVGVILSNRTIKGSCGGLNGATNESGETMCSLCGTPSPECRGEQAEEEPVEARG
ncbi:MAG: (Na+)-NQR maturation NqrM [Pirellulales bacterium]